MEQCLFDSRRADPQIGIVGESFSHQRRQLLVLEPGEPVVGDRAGAGAGRRPLRRRQHRGQRLFFDRRRIRRTLQRTPGRRPDQGSQGDGRGSAADTHKRRRGHAAVPQ